MFALETWGGGSKSLIKRIQNLQDQASKLAIGKLHPKYSPSQRQTKLNWLPINDEITLSTMAFTWKIIHLHIPEEMNSVMPENQTGHRIQAHRKLAAKPKWLHANKITRQSLRNRSYRYNLLPGQITQITDLRKFKKATKQHLKTKPNQTYH